MDKFKLLLTMKEDEAERFHTLLYQVSSVYRSILREIRLRINLLPPSASMAGLYTMVDNTRGVWKAPANISINNVVTPRTLDHKCRARRSERTDERKSRKRNP